MLEVNGHMWFASKSPEDNLKDFGEAVSEALVMDYYIIVQYTYISGL